MSIGETAAKNNKSLGALPGHCRVSELKLFTFEHMQGLNIYSQFLRGCLSLSQLFLIPTGTAMVKYGNARDFRKCLPEKL